MPGSLTLITNAHNEPWRAGAIGKPLAIHGSEPVLAVSLHPQHDLGVGHGASMEIAKSGDAVF